MFVCICIWIKYYHTILTPPSETCVKHLSQFLLGRKMLKFNTEFLALEMSTFQVSDVQEKSSRLKIKTNPGLRVSGSTAKDNDNYSYCHVTTPLSWSANQIARSVMNALTIWTSHIVACVFILFCFLLIVIVKRAFALSGREVNSPIPRPFHSSVKFRKSEAT